MLENGYKNNNIPRKNKIVRSKFYSEPKKTFFLWRFKIIVLPLHQYFKNTQN